MNNFNSRAIVCCGRQFNLMIKENLLSYRLDLNKIIWKLMPFNPNPRTNLLFIPMNVEKTTLCHYNYFLYTFGGFGDRPEHVSGNLKGFKTSKFLLNDRWLRLPECCLQKN